MKHLCFALFLLTSLTTFAQGPKILIVMAHPDDKTMFPVVVFKMTHELKGTADIALLTNGSGGFNGMVASSYFGRNMLDSAIGRKYLPAIRKQEMRASGDILGIKNYFFFNQRDDFYNRDEKPYLQGKRWNIAYVEQRLDSILAAGQYDYVFCLIPHEGQHAHHKTASLSALRAVQRYKGTKKPIILGGQSMNKDYKFQFSELAGYPETSISATAPVFTFDRSYGFGEDNKHSYMIVADWVKAAQLFYDGNLSRDSTISCGFCHQQFAGFGHSDHPLSHGIGGKFGTRNVPGLQNLAWDREFFWDGGISSLDELPIAPLTNPVEMDMKFADVLSRVQQNPEYPSMFKAAFGSDTVTTARFLKAVSQFLLTLVSADSRYDKYARKEAGGELTADELAGLNLFQQKCATCHATDLFTDKSYRNNGPPAGCQ